MKSEYENFITSSAEGEQSRSKSTRPDLSASDKSDGCICTGASTSEVPWCEDTDSSHDLNRVTPITYPVINPPINNIDITEDYTLLTSGVDTLDYGLYVDFADCDNVKDKLENGKKEAQSSKDGKVIWINESDLNYLIHDKGKRNYAYHISNHLAHIWFNASGEATHIPNVTVSIGSEAIWKNGYMAVAEQIDALMTFLTGKVCQTKLSRLDLCMDFKLPEGFTLDFIKSHAVCRAKKTNHYENNSVLETYYHGTKTAPLQLRIYNKSKDCHVKNKLWFFDLWGISLDSEVWRIEFQLRREKLKELELNTFVDLENKQAALWKYLTSEWFSLRIPDNEKTERRAIHPFWQDVIDCSAEFGEINELARRRSQCSMLPQQKLVARVISTVDTLAALNDCDDYNQALNKFVLLAKEAEWSKELDGKSIFSERFAKKKIEIAKREKTSIAERERLYDGCAEDLL